MTIPLRNPAPDQSVIIRHWDGDTVSGSFLQ